MSPTSPKYPSNFLSGKTVIITGASKGIGLQTALTFGQAGAIVIAIARSGNLLKDLATTLSTQNVPFRVLEGDVADEAFANWVAAETHREFGSIDFLINNAGFGNTKPFDTITAEEWDRMFATNTRGTFLFSKAVSPFMKNQGYGHVIVVASDVAKRTFANGALYCSTKFAQHGFADAIRKELRPHGVKVSTIYSGLVDSQFHAEPQGDLHHRTWLTIGDMAQTILYVANQPPHVVIDELMIHPLSQDY